MSSPDACHGCGALVAMQRPVALDPVELTWRGSCMREPVARKNGNQFDIAPALDRNVNLTTLIGEVFDALADFRAPWRRSASHFEMPFGIAVTFKHVDDLEPAVPIAEDR